VIAPDPQTAELVRFAYEEARLIDEKRLDEWYELFTEDALYWIPLTREQPDGINYTSLLYEDKLLLKIRIERLKNPRSFSQQPPSYCQHILQQPMVESAEADGSGWVVRTPFVYVEAQLDAQLLLAGVSRLHVVRTAAGLRIRLKKVDLINREAALPSIQLFP
jgi:3-phenylpropionate/cinnamic acid dioxygenase small subunit